MDHLPCIVVACALVAIGGCAEHRHDSATTTLTAADVAVGTTSDPLVIRRQTPIDREAPLDAWRVRYSDAARVLDDWAARYPRAASALAAWSVDEPEQCEVVVMWAVTYPHASVDELLAHRESWRELVALRNEHPHALAGFLHWTRIAGAAAEELAVRPGGLAVVVAGGNTLAGRDAPTPAARR
jgi:hypothetical protein